MTNVSLGERNKYQISVCDYLIDEYLANQIVKVDKGSRKKHRGNTLYMQVYVY